MPKRVPQLAKLTRPRLHNAVARERLFAKLDEAREQKPAICVVGSPGAEDHPHSRLARSLRHQGRQLDANWILGAAPWRLSVPDP
jgi:hypothetical protein